ncbi:MAG: hypothetical protein FJZ64_01700, partial [Chlamydiae bacterium]|nr:hypothetical protein [Chlamydiota bacterium]
MIAVEKSVLPFLSKAVGSAATALFGGEGGLSSFALMQFPTKSTALAPPVSGGTPCLAELGYGVTFLRGEQDDPLLGAIEKTWKDSTCSIRVPFSEENCEKDEEFEGKFEELMSSFEDEVENFRKLVLNNPTQSLRRSLEQLTEGLENLRKWMPCKDHSGERNWLEEFYKQQVAFESFQSQLQRETTSVEKQPLFCSQDNRFMRLMNEKASPSLIATLWHHLVQGVIKYLPGGGQQQFKTAESRILLHVLGDSFGKKSGFEGNDPLINLSHIERFLRAQEALGNSPFPIEQLREKIELAKKIHDFLRKDLILSSPQNELSALLQKECKKLKINEAFFFPAGWTSETEGHAIVYEIIKEGEDSFRFRVINTGDGVDRHSSQVIAEKQTYLPFLDRTGVRLENLTSPSLMRAIIEMNRYEY